VGEVPFALRNRPVEIGLLPLGAGRRTSQCRLAAVEAVAAGGQHGTCALDGIERMLLAGRGQETELSGDLVHALLARVGLAFTLIGLAFTLIGRPLVLIGHRLAFIGPALALIGDRLAFIGRQAPPDRY
jgi:hypothetical protein